MVGVELFPNPLQVVPIFGDVYGVGAFACQGATSRPHLYKLGGHIIAK